MLLNQDKISTLSTWHLGPWPCIFQPSPFPGSVPNSPVLHVHRSHRSFQILNLSLLFNIFAWILFRKLLYAILVKDEVQFFSDFFCKLTRIISSLLYCTEISWTILILQTGFFYFNFLFLLYLPIGIFLVKWALIYNLAGDNCFIYKHTHISVAEVLSKWDKIHTKTISVMCPEF